MPEAPAWKFQSVLQDLAQKEPASVTLRGRVITGVDDEVIEDGHVSLDGGRIVAVGEGGGRRQMVARSWRPAGRFSRA